MLQYLEGHWDVVTSKNITRVTKWFIGVIGTLLFTVYHIMVTSNLNPLP